MAQGVRKQWELLHKWNTDHFISQLKGFTPEQLDEIRTLCEPFKEIGKDLEALTNESPTHEPR